MHGIPISNITFPVLCLAREGSIIGFHRAEELQQCNSVAFFRNRYHADLIVIDSNFKKFRVSHAALADPLNRFGKFFAQLFNRRVNVKLSFEPLPPCTRNEIDIEIFAWLDRNPAFWEASYDMEEWKRKVKAADSMKALAKLFS